jgi:urease accessory protein UreF
MRIIALGQTEAHHLLARTLESVPAIVDEVIARDGAPESFTPALDVAQMTHPYVRSRLFRS